MAPDPTGTKIHVALELMFSLSDAAGVSATFLMTAPIAEDLGVSTANEAWILGTYSMVFAATLLFAGRLADLYPPHRVYTIGFIGLAIFYLIISFMTDQYAFFVLRSVSALLAVWTIPSSINMIGECSHSMKFVTADNRSANVPRTCRAGQEARALRNGRCTRQHHRSGPRRCLPPRLVEVVLPLHHHHHRSL